jgi:RNA polymerase sigma factor (sigma-70 family)
MSGTLRPRELARLTDAGDRDPADAELLRRYADTGDPEAFARIVHRHARTVLGACRRVLGDPHASEDAFQATFLQLARRVWALRSPAALSGWLYQTARRTALRHRRRLPPPLHEPPAPARGPLDVLTARELLATIEEEIARLPGVYQLPLVLCYLDGLSRDVAADRLGLSAGVFRGRLDRGREKVRAALTRRGLAPAAVLGLLVPTAGPASAGLVTHTVEVCMNSAPVPPTVAALAAGRVAVLTKAGLAAGLLVVLGGLGLIAAPGAADPQSPPATAFPTDPQPRKDLHGDALPPGAIARIGSLRWRHHEEGGNQLLVVPSPTGKHVATAAIGVGAIRVWDLTDGRQLCEFPWEKGAGYEVRFTPDGSRVFYLSERGVVRYFEPTTGKPAGETKPVVEEDVPHRVRGNPDKWNEQWTNHQLTKDGRWVLTTHPENGQFTLLLTELPVGAAQPQQVRVELPDGFQKGVEVYIFTCAGDTLIGAGRDWKRKPAAPVVFRWDLSSGKLTKTTRIEVQENGFEVSPDARRLVTYRGGVRVWDTETGAEVVKLEEPTQAAYGTRFSPDSKHVVGIVRDPADEITGTATVWELDRGKVVGRVKLSRRYDNPFLLADGKTLLAAHRGLMLSTWDVPTGRRLSPAVGHEDRVGHVAFSADGTTLFTASRDRGERIIAWDATTGRKLRELVDAPGGYSRFVLRSDEKRLVTATDTTLLWVDTTTGRVVRKVETAPLAAAIGEPDVSVEVSPGRDPATGKSAVFGYVSRNGFPKLAALWDPETGALLACRPLPGGRGERFEAASPSGRLLARQTTTTPAAQKDWVELSEILGHQSVVLDDALTERTLLQVKQPDYLQGHSLLFTPGGQSFVTWTSTYPPRGENGTPPGTTTVRLWEVRTGKQRLAFSLPVIGKWWEFEPQAVTLSADGRLLAGARPDKTISVWDMTTGAEVAKRAGYGTVVDCLAFRPDGKALASGHADGTAVVWDLSGLPSSKPAAADRQGAWTDLASDDAGKAYRAVLALASDPRCAGFLRNRVKPAAAIPAGEITRLVGDLDSAAFATRERATAALATLGDAAEADLRAALRGDVSAEQRRRIEGVLAKWGLTESDSERLRALRCVEVLERSASAAAREVLAGLANGAAGARLTREAGDAIRRLTPQP